MQTRLLGEHVRHFNAFESKDIAVIIEASGKKDIILKCRDKTVKTT